ncbi:uncharacterized protein [Rhodnius prolixus]|uniref:uncharacterized protein n=1 Tax=Rhodnius prolixus TaxID=13249 RepID=UPI003D1896A4
MDEICQSFQNDIEDTVPKAIAQEILNNLFTQKSSGQFCDVQFLHGSAILWAHSCVLASYSPFMMRLFNKYAEENISWSFSKPMQVNISSVSKCNGSSRNNCVTCTCKIIDFIYTGKIKLDPEHLDHVVNLSNNLEIDVLLLICQRYKRDHLSLLDSLSDSNQISSGSTYEGILDIEAYVDHLHHSISNGRLLKIENEHVQTDIVSDDTQNFTEFVKYSKTRSRDNAVVAKPANKKAFNQVEGNLVHSEDSLKFKKEYVCTACNFKSNNSFKFKQHKKVFHKRNYICLECNYTSFKMGDVLQHLSKSFHGGNTCSVCLFEADSNSGLQSHFNDHSRTYPFRCSLCKQRFKYRNDWVRHKYSPFHEKELFNSIEKLNITSVDEGKQNYACRICKYEFSSSELLQKHSHIFHKRKYICLSCEYNTFKIESILEHLMENEHEENVCSICLFVAKDRNNLKDHLLDHKNTQPFACSVCRSRFQTRNEWWRHELAHGSDKPFKCQYCDLSFQTSPYLKTHILYRHKQKKHTCNICGYGAPFASKLEKHSLIHSNKFKCKVNNCTFNCSSEVMLKKHKKLHVSKPVSCPICNLKFKFAKNVKRHIKGVHNSKNVMLTCPSCSYSNNRIDKMKEHCKNVHAANASILEEVNKRYDGIKSFQVPEAIKKQRRSPTGKEKNTSSLRMMKTENSEGQNENQTEDVMEASKNCDNHFVSKTLTDPLKQTVLLSEATSELNILCASEGKPIPVASVTSTNMVTIGNFREGTGSVTLNETTGVLTLNNINVDSKGAVFLNESTGVLSYINLNIENPPETATVNEQQDVPSEQIQLNEVTGEIVTVTEESTQSYKNLNNNINNSTPIDEEFPFDSFGIDFNEDSCDGFDEFDSLFFDTFSPIDSSASNMEDILKNNTNELFRHSEHNTPRLDEMTGELTFDKDSLGGQCNITSENIWSSVNSFSENSVMESVHTEVYQSLLNEFTGEFS